MTRDKTDAEAINAAIRAAADGPMKGILGVTDRPLVSMDFNHDARSSVFSTEQTSVSDGGLARTSSGRRVRTSPPPPPPPPPPPARPIPPPQTIR